MVDHWYQKLPPVCGKSKSNISCFAVKKGFSPKYDPKYGYFRYNMLGATFLILTVKIPSMQSNSPRVTHGTKTKKNTIKIKSKTAQQPSLPATIPRCDTYPRIHIKHIIQKDQPKLMLKPKYANPKSSIPIYPCISNGKSKQHSIEHISHSCPQFPPSSNIKWQQKTNYPTTTCTNPFATFTISTRHRMHYYVMKKWSQNTSQCLEERKPVWVFPSLIHNTKRSMNTQRIHNHIDGLKCRSNGMEVQSSLHPHKPHQNEHQTKCIIEWNARISRNQNTIIYPQPLL
jgi:hypothetical protein